MLVLRSCRARRRTLLSEVRRPSGRGAVRRATRPKLSLVRHDNCRPRMLLSTLRHCAFVPRDHATSGPNNSSATSSISPVYASRCTHCYRIPV